VRTAALAGACALSAALSVVAAAQGGTGGADVVVSVTPQSGRLPAGALVHFLVDVANRGPVSADGLAITVSTTGLSGLALVQAPYDGLNVSCQFDPSAGLNGAGPCAGTATPPDCATTATSLRCSYSHFVLDPPGGMNTSLQLELSARTAASGHEELVASATAAETDTVPANNRDAVSYTGGAAVAVMRSLRLSGRGTVCENNTLSHRYTNCIPNEDRFSFARSADGRRVTAFRARIGPMYCGGAFNTIRIPAIAVSRSGAFSKRLSVPNRGPTGVTGTMHVLVRGRFTARGAARVFYSLVVHFTGTPTSNDCGARVTGPAHAGR
jgi:hypothetical protein